MDMAEFLRRFADGSDIAVRLCVPVVDAPDIGSEPGSVHMPCCVCTQACWYDSTMVLPLPLEEMRELVVCNHCAMRNPELCAVLAAVTTWPGSLPSWN